MFQLSYINTGLKHHPTRIFSKNVTRSITMISKPRRKRTFQVGSSSTAKSKKKDISKSDQDSSQLETSATTKSESIETTNTFNISKGFQENNSHSNSAQQSKSVGTKPPSIRKDKQNSNLSPFKHSNDESTCSVSTSVLDKLFEDSRKNLALEADMYTAGIKLKNWVTPETPVATVNTEVRGVLATLVKYCFTLRFLRMPPIHSCEFFQGYYFPPWHIIAIGRKSRPSFISIFGKGEEFNGNKEMASSQLLIRRSRNPISYAVGRNYITNSSRKAFWKAFVENPNSVDGVYLVKSLKYPYPNPVVGTSEFSGRQLTALEQEMERFVKRATVTASKPMPWVEKVTEKTNWNFLQNLIKKKVSKPVADKRWLFWRKQKESKLDKS